MDLFLVLMLYRSLLGQEKRRELITVTYYHRSATCCRRSVTVSHHLRWLWTFGCIWIDVWSAFGVFFAQEHDHHQREGVVATVKSKHIDMGITLTDHPITD